MLRITTQRRRSSWASTVPGRQSKLRCGRSMKQSAATSRCDCSTRSIPPDSIQTERQGNWLPRRSPSDMPSPPSNRPSDRSRSKSRSFKTNPLTRSRRRPGPQCRSALVRQGSGTPSMVVSAPRAAAVASSAHCPVAVIRGHVTSGCVLVEVDERPTSNAALAAWGRRGSIARCAASGADAGCRWWSNGADPVGPPSGRLAAPLSRP